MNTQIFENPTELHHAAAEWIVDVAYDAIGRYGKFTWALSGGSTPLPVYALLAESAYRDRIEWEKTFVFWGDERCVPADDVRNNAEGARLMLFDNVSIPTHNIYPIPVRFSPQDAVAQYDLALMDFFDTENPCFDLIMLGLGENGHTASLFPNTTVLDSVKSGFETLFVAEEQLDRITMTAPLINNAHHILFLVEGKHKEVICEQVIRGPYLPHLYPAQLIKPTNGELRWYLDAAAGGLLV